MSHLGVHRLPHGRRKHRLAHAIEDALAPYKDTCASLPFDSAAAYHDADVFVSREQVERPMGTADAQNAAICLAHSATCATHVKDCAHTGVELFNPWTA